MATSFKRLLVKDFPRPEIQKDSIEQTYWNDFEFPTVVKEFSAINYVDISPVEPYDALVTSSAKIQIFNGLTNEIKRTSTRSKDNVFGARYRDDGKLMVAGGESGHIQVLDTISRAILRNFRGHTAATRVCTFSSERTRVFSASDDKTVRQWDIPTEKETHTFKGATDYIRCGCNYPKNPEMFLTGSYDHTVKLWDFRSPENHQVLSLDHGAPVESLIVHSVGAICISAGNNYIKVWDLVAGRLLNQFSNHQKTVTTLSFNGDERRLLSGSLDRNVKVYNVHDYSVVATLNYPSPILTMALSRDDSYLVLGMSDGAISLQKRKKVAHVDPVAHLRADNSEYKVKKIHKPVTEDDTGFRPRRPKARPKKNDVIVEYQTFYKKRLMIVDHHLRRFEYQEALKVCMKREDEVVLSLLTELDRRHGLEIALKNQDLPFLIDFINFLSRNISNHIHTATLIPVANLFTDLYMPMLSSEPSFLKHMIKFNRKMKEELKSYEERMKLLGTIEQIFTLMTPPPKIQSSETPQYTDEKEVAGGASSDMENSVEIKEGTASDEVESIRSADIDFAIDHTNIGKPNKIVID